MVSITLIRENPDVIKKAAIDKGIDVDVERLLSLDVSLREIRIKINAIRTERNRLSKLVQKCSDDNERRYARHRLFSYRLRPSI